MIQSHLVEIAQPIQAKRTELVDGQSVMGACIGWEETSAVIHDLHRASLSCKRHIW